MNAFPSMDIRPYQLLCLICRQGRRSEAEAYPHEPRLDEIQAAVKADPIVPLTVRCQSDTSYRYQNPDRRYDTPEGDRYNDLRDLTVLQRLGLTPGCTRPAIDFLGAVFDAFPSNDGVCGYSEAEAPGWPRCRFADSGNYARGAAKGIEALIPGRPADEKDAAKRQSAAACLACDRLRIRPHHLLCMTCFHDGRPADQLAPIPEDNLCECILAMQRNPVIPVELIHGPCMICPPCSLYHAATNLCVGGRSMAMRDEKKDLDTLRRLGLRYGDVLPARDLLRRIYNTIMTTTEICGNGDGVERSREWRVCGGPTGKAAFERGRRAGLGVSGVRVATKKE